MRIAFFLFSNYGDNSGVTKKILAQVSCWAAEGHTVALYVSCSMSSSAQEWLATVPAAVHLQVERYSSWRGHFVARQRLASRILSWQPDIVYHRFGFYDPCVHRLAAAAKLVYEINSDDVAERKVSANWCHRLYNRMTRRLALSACNGLVFVTGELARRPAFGGVAAPRTVISNGIDLASFTPVPPARNASPRMIFIGSDQPWHGVDKIVAFARLTPKYAYDLVGPQRTQLRGIPPNVHPHGWMAQEQYEPLVAQADVAIGPLAVHRHGLTEACYLKVREYLAYGLATIVGYKDTDFGLAQPFLLILENKEANVLNSVDKIVSFAERWKGRRVNRADVMRLDLREKERQRLRFFSSLLSER